MISAVDADDIYRIPILLHEQHLDAIVCDKLGIEAPPADLREWQQVVAGAPAARRHRQHRDGRQVRADPRFLHLPERGAAPRRPQVADPRAGPLRRVHRPRERRHGEPRRHGRDPRAGRLRRARHRGQDRGRAPRPRAGRALPRHLPRHAGRGDRVRAERPRAAGRELHRVRARSRRTRSSRSSPSGATAAARR